MTDREKARWCYAHASRPESDADALSEGDAKQVAAIYDAVKSGTERLDVAMVDFVAGRRAKLEEAKAVDAATEIPTSES